MENKKYWLETEYNYGDFNNKKWALHEVDENENDSIVLWEAYEDTPNWLGENLDEDWKAIDEYIEDQLGLLPKYEVN